MCARELSMSIANVIRVAIMAAVFLYAPHAEALETLDTSSVLPQHLSLSEYKKHLYGGSLTWSVSRVGKSHEKRLRPSGLLNSKCFTGSNMKVVKDPLGRKNIILVVADLPAACVKVSNTDPLVRADNVETMTLTNTRDIGSAYDLRIPADFAGTVEFCAVKGGPAGVTSATFDNKVSCEQIAIEGVGDGVVDENNRIVSVLDQQRAAEAAAEERRKEEAARRDRAQLRQVANILSLAGRSCDNISRGNAALRQLSGFGIDYRGFVDARNEKVLETLKAQVAKATSLEDVDKLVRSFQKLERYMDIVDPKPFYDLALKRMETIIENQIDNIDEMDSSEARRAERNIKTFRRMAKELMGSESKQEVDKAVHGLYAKLANRASKLGDLDEALEVAERAEDYLPKDLGLDFVEAQRNVLVKQYKKCVNKRAEKGNISKCGKLRRNAEKIQKELEDDADDYASDSDKERYEEDGEELFGARGGLVRTPFGFTYQQPGYGELDIFGLQAMQEAQMALMGGNGFGLQSLLLGGGQLNQMSLLGLNGGMRNQFGLTNGLASPSLGGGMRDLSPARQSPALGFGALGANSLSLPLGFR